MVSPRYSAPTAGRHSRKCRNAPWVSSSLGLEHGYAADDLVLVSEQDILGDRLVRPPKRRQNFDKFIAEGATLAAGRSRRPCRARHRTLRRLVTLEVSGRAA